MRYFLIYLFLEVLISVNISSYIGWFLTFIEIILSALIGFFIIFNFKYAVIDNVVSLVSKEIDIKEFQRLNIYSLIGAIFLIIPGFFTDILGILMQFESICLLIADKITGSEKSFKKKGDDNVIDVEVIDDRGDKC